MSSFKPAASAKLYASPEDIKNVGYRSHSLPGTASRPQVSPSPCYTRCLVLISVEFLSYTGNQVSIN